MISAVQEPQRRALARLAGLLEPATYLAGGVGLAARLHHRVSRDLDLFVPEGDPTQLVPRLAGLDEVVVVSRAEGTLYLEVAGVPVSIIRYAYPLLGPPDRVDNLPIAVASLADLASMKLSAIAGRGARRDFWDVHEIVSRGALSLVSALEAFGRKYGNEDLGHVVKSLVYFADARAEPFPSGLSAEQWARIETDLARWVGEL